MRESLKQAYSYLESKRRWATRTYEKINKRLDEEMEKIKVEASNYAIKLHKCMQERLPKIALAFERSSETRTVDTLDAVDSRAFADAYRAYEWLLRKPLADFHHYVSLLSNIFLYLSLSTSAVLLLLVPEWRWLASYGVAVGLIVPPLIKLATLTYLSWRMHGVKGKPTYFAPTSPKTLSLILLRVVSSGYFR